MWIPKLGSSVLSCFWILKLGSSVFFGYLSFCLWSSVRYPFLKINKSWVYVCIWSAIGSFPAYPDMNRAYSVSCLSALYVLCVKHLLLVTHVIRHVMFSLTDAPQTSVSISPPGDIQEGTDVTLTCTSTSDLPVRSYSWYKSYYSIDMESGKTYTIKHIRPEDSGEYECVSDYDCKIYASSFVYLLVLCE